MNDWRRYNFFHSTSGSSKFLRFLTARVQVHEYRTYESSREYDYMHALTMGAVFIYKRVSV